MKSLATALGALLVLGCGCAGREDRTRKEADAVPCCPSDAKAGGEAGRRTLEVEYLYLDLSVCGRCRGTEDVLRDAVEEARRILNDPS